MINLILFKLLALGGGILQKSIGMTMFSLHSSESGKCETIERCVICRKKLPSQNHFLAFENKEICGFFV